MDIDDQELYKIIFTNDAILEMKDTFEYISQTLYAPNAAKNIMASIDESIDNLKYMPNAYKVIKRYDELNLEYRKIIVKNYSIIYTVNEEKKQIYIAHLYHGRRDYFNLF